MRKTVAEQMPLVPAQIDHAHARELAAISERLDGAPQVLRLVQRDLTRGVSAKKGREGMTAEAVLRCALAKQMNTWSYEELSFHLIDSLLYRWFCRIGIADEPPKKSTLKRNIKRVPAETWEKINALLLQQAAEEQLENGRMVRTDCTVVEANIHAPSDSSLLWDCVRVLARLTERAQERVTTPFGDHRRRAKRRAIGIQSARTKADRVPLYRDLLKVTDKTVRYATAAASALDDYVGKSIMDLAQAGALASEIRQYLVLTAKVADQTRRRILHGESVPASDKIVSIFEPHTDIIRKDHRETLFGHKVALTTGRSGLVLDCVVLEGNPPDHSLATDMIKRQERAYGRPPRQVSLDGGFASKANLNDIKALGVNDVCFTKCRFLSITDMVKSTWVYRKLRRFRAGIEAGISFLKRCFGLDRCTWRSLRSFRAYTWASLVSHNLLVLARHSLA
jgi:IS5 family transposase